MGRRAAKTTRERSPDDPPADPAEVGGCEEPPASGRSSTFYFPQPNRDPVSNWEVDLAKNLEDYLLKICSGELTADETHSVNFAEAALLLQGSVQVYSRKVEYLYTLVLHMLEFISQKRQENPEGSSNQHDRSEATEHSSRVGEENETFLGLDDIPEDTKNSLDTSHNRADVFKTHVKAPANLVVQEADCLDNSGESGELESYLLSTCNFYGDFLLLDPNDAEAVNDFMKATLEIGMDHNVSHRGGSVRSKMRNIFSSPAGRSGGSRHKASIGKKQGYINETLEVTPGYNTGHGYEWNEPEVDHHSPDIGGDPSLGSFDSGNSSDEDDPWKPLNPHEPGCLKVKPFKKVTTFRRKFSCLTKRSTIESEFPIAKLDGIINPEFAVASELGCKAHRKAKTSQSPPLFEKLRQSLYIEQRGDFVRNGGAVDNEDNECDGDSPDFGSSDFGIPEGTLDMDNEAPYDYEKQGHNAHYQDPTEPFGSDAPDLDATLEDLCRSHLDSLLASIAETEKQTELAARVSTWKQRIECNLAEQDSHPPFDIHLYGEKVIAKLSLSVDSGSCMCFTDVVEGQEKHEIARTFSAMLQLVNNGNIELIKPSKHESFCYTASNPFSIRFINDGRRAELQVTSLKKRMRSPLRKACSISKSLVSPSMSRLRNGKPSTRLSKGSKHSTSPDSKRRRQSRLIRPVQMQLDG